MAGQKSKKANRINIQNAVYCKLLTDESGSTTYDEPKSLSPAMQVQLTATLASGILHGDGVQQENIAKITGISMVLDVNKIPIEDRAIILGNKYENGILEEVGGDEATCSSLQRISTSQQTASRSTSYRETLTRESGSLEIRQMQILPSSR